MNQIILNRKNPFVVYVWLQVAGIQVYLYQNIDSRRKCWLYWKAYSKNKKNEPLKKYAVGKIQNNLVYSLTKWYKT